MGKKKNSFNFGRQAGEEEEIFHRPAPPVAALYLMKLREQMPKIPLPQRRLPIHMDPREENPQTVRIRIHLKSAAEDALPAVESVSPQPDTNTLTRDGG